MPTQDEDLGYRWWIKIRNAPLVGRQVPLDSALSYPIIAQGELRCFHYLVKDGQIKRPFTYVRATLPEVQVIELLLDRHQTLYPGLPQQLGDYKVVSDNQRHRLLLNLVPTLAQNYLREPAGEAGKAFLLAFDQEVPGTLRPFYEALNPKFFQWLSPST